MKVLIPKEGSIRNLSKGGNSGEEKGFLDEAWKLKSNPGVMKFEVMKEISSNNPYEFGISMEFEDQESYNFYSNHPAHAQFVEQHWIPNVEVFMEIDYLLKESKADESR